MASYFYRVVALLHSYERHLRIAERARKQTDKLESKQKKPLRRHEEKFYSQSPWKAMVYYAAFKSIFLLLVIITASLEVAQQSWVETAFDCTVWGTGASIVADAIIVVMCVILLIKNNVNDPFLITTELKMTVYMAILTMGPWGIIWIIENRGYLSENAFVYAKLYVILTFTFFAQTLQLGFPLYYTYAFSRRRGDEKAPRAKLMTVLLSDAHRERFMKFLVSEWSSENLLFFEEVNKWLENFQNIENGEVEMDVRNVGAAKDKAHKIFEVYIDPNDADCQVNLPSRLINPLVSFFKNRKSSKHYPKEDIEMGATEFKDGGRSIISGQSTSPKPDTKLRGPHRIPGVSPGTSNGNVSPDAGLNFEVQRIMNDLRLVLPMMMKAKRVIFQLMERDSYNRFCGTEEGEKIMFEIQKLKLERKASQTAVA
eukprot:CAMPEP_0114496608 /NCGR_PEP_ID=MMETSP0109-20121206/5863_1 /TAXON_ID=29199 /ORGANISM="Chlorarachnion reptans, Strain CCCM449" /LENGTH=426 /DNA_ID=CAMNT_0001673897 /DNA_START=425 /DNA_END=1705 /DNA_ORIENTATION=+